MVSSTENERPAPFQHIVVATDFSAGAVRAVARTSRLPLAEGGKVTVTHVLSDRVPKKARADAEKLARRHLEQVSKSLRKAAAALGRRDITVSSELCEGQPYVEIIRHARAVAADLIVIGRHGRRPVRDMFIGSCWRPVVLVVSGPLVFRLSFRDRGWRTSTGADLSPARRPSSPPVRSPRLRR